MFTHLQHTFHCQLNIFLLTSLYTNLICSTWSKKKYYSYKQVHCNKCRIHAWQNSIANKWCRITPIALSFSVRFFKRNLNAQLLKLFWTCGIWWWLSGSYIPNQLLWILTHILISSSCYFFSLSTLKQMIS